MPIRLPNRQVLGLPLLLVVLTLTLAAVPTPPPTAQNQRASRPPKSTKLLERMLDAMQNLRDISFYQVQQERVDGEMKVNKFFTKVQFHPYKVYIRNDHPRQAEVLYDSNLDREEALVAPKGFPWTNMELDIHGGMMRKNQHFSILEMGYRIIEDYIHTLKSRYGASYLKRYQVNKQIFKVDGRSCYRLQYHNPDVGRFSYTVQPNENVWKLARKFGVHPYKIRELNGLDDDENPKPGDKITLPEDFAHKLHFYIDVNSYLPVKIQIWDENGLYGSYTFQNMQVNPGFSAADFSPENEDYGF